VLLFSLACGGIPHPPVATWDAPEAASSPSATVDLTTVVSATWQVPLAGLLDLEHPTAQAAGLEDEDRDIVMTVHVVRHPSGRTWIVDTGVAVEDGEHMELRGLVKKVVTPHAVESLDAILESRDLSLDGVALTHLHIDHVMGLPQVPTGTPVLIGPGEAEQRRPDYAPLRGTYRRLLRDHNLVTPKLDDAVSVGPIDTAWDVFGDGSFWALHVPGHTPGSLAFLAHTDQGAVLLAGDTSHTRWGWDNAVPPGGFTSDAEGNQESLDQLRQLAEETDARVVVGHE